MCVSVGDGRMGYTEEAPYDAIHVGAAAPTVPQAVSLNSSGVNTLKSGGQGHIVQSHFKS